MRNSYSRTAQSMAVLRAIEFQGRSKSQQILSDPWAWQFIPSVWWRLAAGFPLTARLVSTGVRWWIPGAQEYALARARFVDEATARLAAEGVEQLVLLGAGFDTTVFRLGDQLRSVRVFEVDHPATQCVKLEMLGRQRLPQPVQFVAVDFEVESFVDKLREAGFDPGRRTLLTWLGVTYYLSPEAVNKTVAHVAELLTPASHFIFDFVPPEAQSGTLADKALQSGLREASRLGEPFLCGLDPNRLHEWLAQFGFQQRGCYDHAWLRRRYCQSGRAPVRFMWLAEAERI
ncbi:MAG TPA: SAM-dependent methyltransferase [Gemmataceae bacterium]|nr:SAM-dependent methyltransferase [Gemmataceae bacterium]